MQITIDTNTGIITINGETLEIKGQGKPIEHTVTLLHTPEETKAEKTKRLWMVWADRFGIKREYIEEHAEFKANGDVIWDGDCDWFDERLTEFPPNFVEVTGYFSCSKNQLTSLEGAPQTVGGDFYCRNNKNITSIPAGIQIGGFLRISGNQQQLRADAESKGYNVGVIY